LFRPQLFPSTTFSVHNFFHPQIFPSTTFSVHNFSSTTYFRPHLNIPSTT
jgi:hypothetical protein